MNQIQKRTFNHLLLVCVLLSSYNYLTACSHSNIKQAKTTSKQTLSVADRVVNEAGASAIITICFAENARFQKESDIYNSKIHDCILRELKKNNFRFDK